MVAKAKASHIGSALSIADIVAVLYADVLKVFPDNPKNPFRDRLILSKGHACVAVYAALAELKFFPKKDLETYGDDYSPLMNHISHKVPGVEFSTGALGHGLPFGVGKALYAKKRNLSWHVFVILSDGELDEGSNWEALMFASHHKLSNLTVIVDYNKLQSLTSIDKTLGLEPLAEKFTAFGADVIELNGHDHSLLSQELKISSIDQPKVIIAHTIKGKGVSFMENQVLWHYRSPNEEQLLQAIREIEVAYA
jgi:transketolase